MVLFVVEERKILPWKEVDSFDTRTIVFIRVGIKFLNKE
jgi:hypothetical protein